MRLARGQGCAIDKYWSTPRSDVLLCLHCHQPNSQAVAPEGYYVLPPIRVEDGRVPQPSDHNDSLLRRVLSRWAARFTSDERIQAHLVEKTISEILLEFPTADDASPIDVVLLATMRRVLLRDFQLRPATESPSDELPTRIDDQ
jgi:hypothetical protein